MKYDIIRQLHIYDVFIFNYAQTGVVSAHALKIHMEQHDQ